MASAEPNPAAYRSRPQRQPCCSAKWKCKNVQPRARGLPYCHLQYLKISRPVRRQRTPAAGCSDASTNDALGLRDSGDVRTYLNIGLRFRGRLLRTRKTGWDGNCIGPDPACAPGGDREVEGATQDGQCG